MLAYESDVLVFFSADETAKARNFFIATFFFALFFWAWALKNTVENEFDLGVVSFATVLVSSSYMMGALTSGSLTAGKSVKTATTCTHIFVALNYALGAAAGFAIVGRIGFGIYCTVFTALWSGIAYFGHLLMKSVALGGETLPLHS